MAILDSRGRPFPAVQSRADLARPYAVPSLTGVRQTWDAASVASGLTPETLAGILREADLGDGRAYLRLAMEMEQRDLHYRSVLGTRKRAVTRLPITVESASDDKADVALADEIRALIRVPGFRSALPAALDGLGKGLGVVEMCWDTTRTPWMPRDRRDAKTGERIRGYRWIDPRWFRYDRETGRELRLLDEQDMVEGIPLPPYRYIVHEPELMSGAPLGRGLARVACVAYMAKSFSLKDWLAFAEVYGMPLRVGKYGPGATEEDIATLVSAVANLGTDAAAVIPESMVVEFVTGGAAGTGAEVFRGLAQWADDQLSKGVLGQTASAEGGAPGMGGQDAQTEVREDIRDADGVELAETLNRDLVAPYLALNHGEMDPEAAPRICIAAVDQDDIPVLTEALSKLVPLGLRVEQSVVRDKLGLPDPAAGADCLGAPAAEPPPVPARAPALNRAGAAPGQDAAPDYPPALLDQLTTAGQAAIGGMLDQVRTILASAQDLGEAAALLDAAYPDLDSGPLEAALTGAALVAHLSGRADVMAETGQ